MSFVNGGPSNEEKPDSHLGSTRNFGQISAKILCPVRSHRAARTESLPTVAERWASREAGPDDHLKPYVADEETRSDVDEDEGGPLQSPETSPATSEPTNIVHIESPARADDAESVHTPTGVSAIEAKARMDNSDIK